MRSRSDRVSAGVVRRDPGLGAANARGEDARSRIRTGDHTLVRVNGGVESDADGEPGDGTTRGGGEGVARRGECAAKLRVRVNSGVAVPIVPAGDRAAVVGLVLVSVGTAVSDLEVDAAATRTPRNAETADIFGAAFAFAVDQSRVRVKPNPSAAETASVFAGGESMDNASSTLTAESRRMIFDLGGDGGDAADASASAGPVDEAEGGGGGGGGGGG